MSAPNTRKKQYTETQSKYLASNNLQRVEYRDCLGIKRWKLV